MTTLRDQIGRAIVDQFQADYETHGCSYDPDTCYRAADAAIAVILSALTGLTIRAEFSGIVGPATFHEDFADGPGEGDSIHGYR